MRIEGALGARKGLSAFRVHDVFARRVLTSIPAAAKITGLTPPTVSAAIEALERLGVVREITARQRNRQFVYDGYLRVFEAASCGSATMKARLRHPVTGTKVVCEPERWLLRMARD